MNILQDIQSLDDSISQMFHEYKASHSKNIQVRNKSILVSNIKLFVGKSTVCHLNLKSISVKKKTIVRNVLHTITAYYMTR